MTKIQSQQFRNFFILLGSTLSVMQGALISPALTHISEHFSEIDNIVFLSKLIIAIPPIFTAVFSPVAGILFEKFGRKKILIFSAVLYGISGSSGYFADNIYLILAGRALMGISIAGLMTGFIIIVGDIFAGKKDFNKFIGQQGAFMSFGGVIYLLSGEYLANLSWNVPFLGYLFSILIAVGLLTFFRETKAVKSTEPLMTGIKDIDKYPKFIKIHLLAVFLMIIYLMVPTQIPFILLEYSELNSRNAGIFLAVWILFSSLASFAYSKIRKLLDYYKSFSLALIFWSLGFLMIFWADNYIVVLIALIIAGIGNGIAIPNIKAQMLDYAGEKQRAKQSGLLSMSLYIGQFLSPVLVEPIIQASTPRIPFLIFSLIMLILILVFYKQSKK